MFSFNNTQKTKSLLEANIMSKEIQVEIQLLRLFSGLERRFSWYIREKSCETTMTGKVKPLIS